MISVADIREWRGAAVVDEEGSKIGSLEAVYFDTLSDEPMFATVKVGIPGGGKLIFVPLDGARVSPKQVHVKVGKKLAKNAPAIATEGELAAETEAEIYQHYNMTYERGASGERRLGRR